MNQSKISIRYAKALFLSAKEKNLLLPVRNDMNLVHNLFHSFLEVRAFFSNPVINPDQKKQTINRLLNGSVNELSMSFLYFVISQKRESFIIDITRNFNDLYRKDLGIKTVVFTTAFPVDPQITTDVFETVKKNFRTEVEIKELINEKIIGGFVLQIENILYDSSAATKLKKIRKELVNTTFEKKF